MADIDYVISIPTREPVLRRFAQVAIDQKIVAVSAHYVVGTSAAGNNVVSGTTYQVLVAPPGGALVATKQDVPALPAQQIVAAVKAKEVVLAALANEVVVFVGTPQGVGAIGTDLVHRQSHPACQYKHRGHPRQQKRDSSHDLLLPHAPHRGVCAQSNKTGTLAQLPRITGPGHRAARWQRSWQGHPGGGYGCIPMT